jgi:mannose PTS system EIIA component
MTTEILIVAHVPLASALRACAQHVYPERMSTVFALDVDPQDTPEHSLALAKEILSRRPSLNNQGVLILSDMFGATPCNVAQRLLESHQHKLICGLSLPMLLRAICYQSESLEQVAARALAGGAQGVMSVSASAPQEHRRQTNDQDNRYHQQ